MQLLYLSKLLVQLQLAKQRVISCALCVAVTQLSQIKVSCFSLDATFSLKRQKWYRIVLWTP